MSDVDTAPPPLAAPRGQNPFTQGDVQNSAVVRPLAGLISVEQQRAVAEVQARMMIARANPRDPIRAMERILNACTRPTLAQAAVYQYARGGTDIRGPSIRLAEALAQQWGNIASGFKILGRHGDTSECVAYAWDLETGFYDERQFPVRHWRDTRQGGYALSDERDIYEAVANMAQRRKRAVLLTVIPGDVIEAALEQCERTMTAAADVTPDGIRKLVEAFAEFNVTQPQIEARIQRRLDAIRPAQVVMLRKVFNSLRDGMSEVGDWFEGVPLQGAPAIDPTKGLTPEEIAKAQGSAPRRRGRPSRAQQQQQTEPAAAPSGTADVAPTTSANTGTEGGGSPPGSGDAAPSTAPAERGRVQFEF